MANDVNARLTAIMERKRAAEALAAETSLATQRAADEKGAKRLAAKEAWESVCRPMIKGTIERFNRQTVSDGVEMSLIEAANPEPAIADARVMLQLSGKKNPFAMTISVNPYGMVVCRTGTTPERPVSLHLDALTEAAFENLLLDFLDKSILSAAVAKAAVPLETP